MSGAGAFLAVLTLAGAACAQSPLPPERPAHLRARPETKTTPASVVSPAPPSPAPDPVTEAICAAQLAAAGAVTEGLRDPVAATQAECAIAAPVILLRVRRREGADIQFPDRPLLACATAATLATFTRDVLDPLAQDNLARRLKTVGTGPGHACRTRNRQPGAKMSAHGRGLAVDIMQIAFEAGPPIVVAKREGAAQDSFVAKLLDRACTVFNTVLGPKSDSFHADNIHLDLEPRGRDGKTKYCR